MKNKKLVLDTKLKEITKKKKNLVADDNLFNKILEESTKHLPFDYKKK